MSIATEILSLRHDQSSSVQTLLALLDWQRSAQKRLFAETRRFAVTQAADLVLVNVAAHAAEALNAPEVPQTPQAPKARRTIRSLFRRRRGSDAPKLKQRMRRPFA